MNNYPPYPPPGYAPPPMRPPASLYATYHPGVPGMQGPPMGFVQDPRYYAMQAPMMQARAAGGEPASSRFVKGALIGAVAAYLLTNEKVQQTAIKAAVKSWSMLQGGVEEMKERFRDAEAELHASHREE